VREHKYKAWNKKCKRIEDVDGYDLYLADGRLYEISEETHYYETYMKKNDVTDDYILLEYTGLKDSKRTPEYPEGQEIYENYIVRYTDGEYGYVGYIVFKNGAFIVSIPYDNDWLDLRDECGNIEIIGNIFQNLELKVYLSNFE
jgi:hypothetical protein